MARKELFCYEHGAARIVQRMDMGSVLMFWLEPAMHSWSVSELRDLHYAIGELLADNDFKPTT